MVDWQSLKIFCISFRITKLVDGTYFTKQECSVIEKHMSEAIEMAKLAANRGQVETPSVVSFDSIFFMFVNCF